MTSYRPRPWLFPLAALHGAVLRIRHFAFDVGILRSQRAVLPTWVVGNITVGGTGKSPHVRLMVRELEEIVGTGCVGVLSRGYGRATTGFVWVEPDAPAEEVGDEPRMLKGQIPQAPIAVCADRVEGVRRMHAERPELQWVVLDDALQHRRLVPDVAMVLVDATQPVAQDRLIPAGRLRDLRSRLKRADVGILTRAQAEAPLPKGPCPWFTTQMVEGVLTPWSTAARNCPLPKANSHPTRAARILAVAGIARPERFMDRLAASYQIARREAFPDHHDFPEHAVRGWLAAFDTDGIAALVTTEKDAVRMERHRTLLDRVPVYYVPLQAEWLNPNEAKQWIRETAEQRRNS